jgi:hypothetical protein
MTQRESKIERDIKTYV